MANWFGGQVEEWDVSKDGEGYAYTSQEVKDLCVQVQEDGELRASYQSKVFLTGDMQDGSVSMPNGEYTYIEDMTLEEFLDTAKDTLCTEHLKTLGTQKDVPISVDAENIQFDIKEEYVIEDSKAENVKVNFEVSGQIEELANMLPGISDEANFYVDVHANGDVSICATRVDFDMHDTPDIYLDQDSADAVKARIEEEYDISLNEILESIQPSDLHLDAQHLTFEDEYMLDVAQNGEIVVNFYVAGIIPELEKLLPDIDDGANCYVNVYSSGDVSVQAYRTDGYEQCSPEYFLDKQSAEDVREACNAYIQKWNGQTLENVIQDYDDQHTYKAVNIQWENNDSHSFPEEARIPSESVRVKNYDSVKKYLEEQYDGTVVSYDMNDNLASIAKSTEEAANESITKTGEGSYVITNKKQNQEFEH